VVLPDKGLVHEGEVGKPLGGSPLGAQPAQAAGAESSHLLRVSHQRGQCVCPARVEPHLTSLEMGGKSRLLPQGSG